MATTATNTKPLKPGMICEWRELDVYTGRIVRRFRVRLLELLDNGWWVFDYRTGKAGGGWDAWMLHPLAK